MPSVLRLLVALLAAAALADATGASASLAEPATAWPLGPPLPLVVQPFDAPSGPYAPGHRGVDLAAGAGQPVFSARPGRVVFAGPVAGRPVISVDHAQGLRTTYEPVVASVTRGDLVTVGQPLGTVSAAAGHCVPATCLHWGLRRGETYLDPLMLLGSTGVRLLPVWRVGPPSGRPQGGIEALRGRPERPDRGPLLADG